MPTTPPTEVPPEWLPWVLGALIFVITTLSGVVAYLFKLYTRRERTNEKIRQLSDATHNGEREKWLEEKAAWDAEREAEHAQLARQYEEKIRELAEHYIKQSTHDREQHLAREEQIRQDNASLLEKLADKSEESRALMVSLLQKMHDKFLGGRRRPGG